MPRTRKRVYVDNETEKNRRVYSNSKSKESEEGKAVTRVNKRVTQASVNDSKEERKISSVDYGKSSMKKQAKKGKSDQFQYDKEDSSSASRKE